MSGWATDMCLAYHALKDLSRRLDGQDDCTETGCQKDDIGGGLGGFRSTLDSDTTISFLE